MRWKPTWLLLALTAMLFAFICFVERHTSSTLLVPASPQALLSLKPEEISQIKLERVVERTNKFDLWLEKTNQAWHLTLPQFYPAQARSVENLLQRLATMTTLTYITPQEMAASRHSVADYGLDIPLATLRLSQGDKRSVAQIMFGAKTPVGDQVYVQLLSSPGVYVVDAAIFDGLPRTDVEWRDVSLLNLVGLSLDRMEVRAPGRGFALQENQTNRAFYLSKPQVLRASRPRVEALLEKIQVARVVRFVTDDPRAELEPYGLQPPEAELAFGVGTNDVVVVQFGKSPTNDPSLVYARRLAQTNIVLVSRTVLDAVLTPHTELRDRRLFSFAPAALDTIEVTGRDHEKFTLRRQTNGAWMVTEPQPALADPELMREWLDRLDRVEGNVEKDVVTDFAAYGLNPPSRQYALLNTITNADGGVTNRLLSRLDIGGIAGAPADKIFVRRTDEDSVYSIPRTNFDQLPAAAWQLRDRRVWAFTTNQLTRVSVRHQGYTRQWERSATGQWRFAAGSQGILDDKVFALDETIYLLGELRASLWVAKGEENRGRYGFTDDGYKMTIDLNNGDKPAVLSLEFGALAPSGYFYAQAMVEGQVWIFEFPKALYLYVTKNFSNPPPRAAASVAPGP